MYPENQSSVQHQHYNYATLEDSIYCELIILPKSAFLSSNKYQLFLPPLNL